MIRDWRLLWDLTSGNRKTYIADLFWSAARDGLHSLTPALIGILIDLAMGIPNPVAIATLSGVLIAVFLLQAVAIVGNSVTKTYLGAMHALRLRSRVLKTVTAFDELTLGRFSIGDLASRHDGDVQDLMTFYTQSITALITRITSIVSTMLIIAVLEPLYAWGYVVYIPVLMFTIFWGGSRIRSANREAKTARAAHVEQVRDLIKAGTHLKLWHAYRMAHDCYITSARKRLKAELKHDALVRLQTLACHAGGHATLIILVCFPLVVDSSRLPSAGVFLSLLVYVDRMRLAVVGLIRSVTSMQGYSIALKRLKEVMAEPGEKRSHCLPRHTGDFDSLRLKEVGFRYPTSGNGLSPVSLTVKAGARVAVRGASGTGKSTLLKIIARLIHDYDGSITIGDMEFTHMDTRMLRRCIVLIPQMPSMIAGTVRDNILMGHNVNGSGCLDEVCRVCCLADYIGGLPVGLDTLIGEKNRGVSGGQAKRLAIARACVRRPSILLLDEPTAGLHRTMALTLIDNLFRFLPDTAFLVATHDPEVVSLCERVLDISTRETTDRAGYVEHQKEVVAQMTERMP